MVAFTERFRYRLGKKLSRIAEPPLHSVPLSFSVILHSTNPVEYLFPTSGVFAQALLDEERTFYHQTSDIVLAPDTQHASRQVMGPVELAQAISSFEKLPSVSENLFRPLGRRTTQGKHFNKDSLSGQLELFANFGLETKKTEKIDGYRKSFSERKVDRNHTSRKGADI